MPFLKISDYKFILKILLICLLFFSQLLFFSIHAEAGSEERQKILRLDLSKDENLTTLNNYLSKTISEDNILDYFTARQLLLSLPYEELAEFSKKIEKVQNKYELNKLIKSVLDRKLKENIYLLSEDIYINNVPLMAQPFYHESPEQNLNITDLNPQEEHIYFDNLELTYKKNELLKEEDELWINPRYVRENAIKNKKKSQRYKSANILLFDSLLKTATEIWSYRLPDNNLSDFLFDGRQWIKRYQESLVEPVIYKNTVILRNEYRLFCLDLVTGEEIWSFGNMDKSSRERYQTYRHMHHNSHGYELLLSGDAIFTELNGKLIGLDLKNIFSPQLLWSQDLGAYTLCTKPIKTGNILVSGIANARGEFWICGFDSKKGILIWNAYIGTSSFLSPASIISSAEQDRVYIGTNYGVLVCLDPGNGEIAWTRKYVPRKYNLFDYWGKGYALDKILGKGSIPYDTQFIEIGDDRLYYKPRESDYLCILNLKNGRLREEILIDTDRFYLLGICNDKAVFLENNIDTSKNAEIKIVGLDSGKQIYNIDVEGGNLQGVYYANKNEMLFKVDKDVHFLQIDKNNIHHTQIDAPAPGWLLNYYDGFLLIEKDRQLNCIYAYKERYLKDYDDHENIAHLHQREKIKNNFKQAVQLEPESNQASELRKQLLSEIKRSTPPLDTIFPIIVDNLQKLHHSAWHHFFTTLAKLYNNEVVNYKNIDTTFTNFLYGANLINRSFIKRGEFHVEKIDNKKKFQVRGNRLFLVPIEIIKGSKSLNSFLLLNNDQLLCIDEEGSILWGREIFYGPLVNYNIEYNKKRIIYTDWVEASLYEHILIINDRINIIAVDIRNGAYLWSMTTKESKLKEEKKTPLQKQDDLLLNKYGIHKSYLENIMFYTKFINDSIIIVRGNKIYSVDPITGFCKRYRELDIEGAVDIKIKDNAIYLLPYSLNKIITLNEELESIKIFSLEDLSRDKYIRPELHFIKDYIILNAESKENSTRKGKSDLYLLNRKTGKIENGPTINGGEFYFIDSYGSNLLIITPFQKITNYRVEINSLIKNWEFEPELTDKQFEWRRKGKDSKYYFIVDDHLLFPFRKKGDYYIAAIDLKTGKTLWEKYLDGVKGFFYYLSNFERFDEIITFMLSTTWSKRSDAIVDDVADNSFRYIDSRLFGINYINGEIRKTETLPAICSRGFKNMSIIETKDHFIYCIYGNVLKVEDKSSEYHGSL